MADRPGRIIVRPDGVIVCDVHGDNTEATTVTAGDRIVVTRWTCIDCGATRTTTPPKEST